MGISIQGRQAGAHRMIQRWGGIGFLIRGDARRAATMAINEYTPRERALFLEGSTRFSISVVGLALAPDHELDIIEFQKMRYKIVLPISGPKPTGVFVYYDAVCTYTETIV